MEATAKKQVPTLMPDRFGLAEHRRSDWVADVPITVTLQDAMEPSYWAHVASQMNPLDHIEVRSEDGSWIAYLIVSFCEKNYAKVVLDRIVKIGINTDAPASSIKHEVRWRGPHSKFGVIRLSDSQVLQEGFPNKDLAIAWMTEHEKTLGR